MCLAKCEDDGIENASPPTDDSVEIFKDSRSPSGPSLADAEQYIPERTVPGPLSIDELIRMGREIVNLLYNERNFDVAALRNIFTAEAVLDFDGQINTLLNSESENHEWLAQKVPNCTAELLHASATISRKTLDGRVVLTLLFPGREQGAMRGGHISAKWTRDTDMEWRCCSFAMLWGPQGLPFGGKAEPLISRQIRS